MYLQTVTLTGADDSVTPEALDELSESFPFVEWGILMSPGRAGSPRYPSVAWLERLRLHRRLGGASKHLKLSAHLCGSYAREFLFTSPYAVEGFEIFERWQINGFSLLNPPNQFVANNIINQNGTDIIFQITNDDAFNRATTIADLVPDGHDRVHVLFDRSGGRGVFPENWPRNRPFGYVGYAGGLGPENVRAEIEKLAVMHFSEPLDIPFWIDMETSLRGERGEFDLNRAVAVLNAVEEYWGFGN